MRLTLRTLLAYLDDVLEPADAQVLGKKIEESEFAGNLVQRIRNSIRRLRLGAPRLDGKGVGLDANTVAEYLDNVLAADRMPEFEKVCLDSDVHLAEAAGCHQILTLVLGEPADVEPSTRERVYRIGSPTVPMSDVHAAMGEEPPIAASLSASATTKGPSADSSTSAADKVTAAPSRHKPEVPDYLREESGIRLWPLLATVLLCFLLAGAVIVAMGPLDASHPLAKWLGLQGETPPVAVGPNGTPGDGGTTPTDPGVPDPMAGAGGPEVSPMVDPMGTIPSPMPGATPPMVDPAETPAVTPMPVPMIPAAPVGEAPPVAPPATPMPAVPPVDPETPSAPPTVPPGETPPVPPVGPVPAPMPGTPAIPPVETPAAAVDVGRYASTDDVLLRFVPADESWQRLPRGAAVSSGDRLVATPAFRPQLLLAGGVHVTLDGGTQLTLQAPAEGGLPQFRVDYGRVMLASIGMPGTQVAVQLGERKGVISFGDADSQVAVEVRRYLNPGLDPEKSELHRLVEAYVTSGNITWQEVGQKAIPIAAGHVFGMLDMELGRTLPVEAFPDWISGKDQGDVDKIAAATLRELLVVERPAQLTLREEAQDRRPEVRSLAIRALAYLGEFESAYSAFNDTEVRSNWPAHFDALTACLAISPDARKRVREGLERASHDDGPVIYRMLWGYTPTELKGDEGRKLVDALEHNSLAVRVVAFENLRRITGQTHAYRPEYTPVRRKPYVVKWREKLNSREGIEFAKPLVAPAAGPRPAPAAEPPLPDAPSPPALPGLPAVPPTTPPLPGGPLFPPTTK